MVDFEECKVQKGLTMEKELKNKNESVFITQILKAVKSIQYGYIQITVQDSKVVQIDKTEKIRLDRQNYIN